MILFFKNKVNCKQSFFPFHAAPELYIWSQLNFGQYRPFWSSVREIIELWVSHGMDDTKDLCVFNKYCAVKPVVSSNVLDRILS